VKPDSGTSGRIVAKGTYGGSMAGYSLQLWTDKVIFIISNGSEALTWSNSSIIDGQWKHLVGTRDTGGNMKLYVDGIQQDDSDVKTGSISTVYNLCIGTSNTDVFQEWFDGLIDEVRIYNRALSAEEIRYHYNRGGPVAHWTFDEGNGTTTYDGTDNDNDGTMGDGTCSPGSGTCPTWTTGMHGTALSFDGTDDDMKIPDDASLNITDSFTIEAWVYPNDVSIPGTIYSRYSGNSGYELRIEPGYTPDRLIVVIADGSTWKNVSDVNNVLITKDWQHVVGTFDGTNLRLYIDTVLVGGPEASNLPASASADAHIGSRSGSHHFWSGLIDDVRIYNYARTPAEIALDYNAGFAAHFGPKSGCDDDPGSCMDLGLVGYWGMEEGGGDTAYDASLYSNDGTLTNNPTWTTGVNPLSGGDPGGNALEFDGTNDYVDCGSDGSLNFVDEITVEAWVKSNDISSWKSIFDRGWNRNWHLSFRTSKISFRAWDVDGGLNGFEGNTVLESGVWYHVVAVYNDSEKKVYFYLNGNSDGGGTFAKSMNNTGWQTPFIGAYGVGTDFNFDGSIDEVKIFNRTLSAAEVRYHYNRGGPVGYWKFDEGNGQTAFDSSGSNDGTLGTGSSVDASDPAWTTGMHGTALSFDGQDDYVSVADSSSLDITDAITLEAWVKKDTTKNQAILSKDVYEVKINDNNKVIFDLEALGNELLVNAGAEGQTDWADGNSDGLADSWTVLGSPVTTIVTGNGFVGDAQKIEIAGVTYAYLGQSQTLSAAKQYKMTCKYRSSTAHLRLRGSTGAYLTPSFPQNTGNATSYTVYFDGDGGNMFYFFVDYIAGNWYEVDEVSVKEVIANSGKIFTSNNSVPTDYNHIVATSDGSSVKIYLNGVLDYSFVQSITISTNALNLLIGKSTSGEYFDGVIDDVRIYNYVRTPQEIALDYNAGFAVHFGPQSGCDDDPGSCMDYGLVGYWPFDEGSGSLAYDASEGSNDGTIYGNPGWTTGINPLSGGAIGGGALDLDRTKSNYVDCGDTSSLTMGTSDFSVETWMKTSDTGNYRGVVGKGEWTPVDDGYGIALASGNIRLVLGVNKIFGNVSGYTDGNWHHVIVVADRDANGYIYVDSVEEYSGSISAQSSTDLNNTKNFQIGYMSGTGYLDSTIDEVRVYNRALSAEEVRYHYNRGAPVAHWRFDEGSGQIAFDESNNDNDGFLGTTTVVEASDPTWTQGKFSGALLLDGTDDFVNCGTSQSLDITGALTLEAWIKADAFDCGGLFCQIIDKFYTAYHLRITNTANNQKIQFYVHDGGTAVAGNTSLSPGVWYHVVGVFSPSEYLKVYLNGVEDGAETTGVPASTNSTNYEVLVGARVSPLDAFFHGFIDDVRIYNYARGPEQILQDYNQGLGIHFK